jgi:hypothetical protein
MEGIMVPLEEYLALQGDYQVIQWCYWITLALLTIAVGTMLHAAREIRKRDRTIAELYMIKAGYEKAMRRANYDRSLAEHLRTCGNKSVESGG